MTLCLGLATLVASLATAAPSASARLTATDRVYLQARSERSAARISLDEAANMVRRRTGGKVIGSRTRQGGGRTTYTIKVLKDGNVRSYTVDASTGAIR